MRLAPKPDEQMGEQKITTIYDDGLYIAQHHARSDVVVVCRRYSIGQRSAATHVGEKHPSEDWREVRLRGCPDEVRAEIIKAFKAFKNF